MPIRLVAVVLVAAASEAPVTRRIACTTFNLMMRARECAGADSACDRCNIRIDSRSRIETGRVVCVARAAEMGVRLDDETRRSEEENR